MHNLLKQGRDNAGYRQVHYGEMANVMKSALAKAGWTNDFIDKNTPAMPIPGWMRDDMLRKSDKVAWGKGQDSEVGIEEMKQDFSHLLSGKSERAGHQLTPTSRCERDREDAHCVVKARTRTLHTTGDFTKGMGDMVHGKFSAVHVEDMGCGELARGTVGKPNLSKSIPDVVLATRTAINETGNCKQLSVNISANDHSGTVVHKDVQSLF